MKTRLTSLFIAFVLLLSACGQTSNTPTWQEQYDLGVRYLSEGNYEEAIIAFTAAIEIDPKQAPAYVGRGNAFVLNGDADNLSRAQSDYETAIDLDDSLVDAYLGLADIYVEIGELEHARALLDEALEKITDPENIDIIEEKIIKIAPADVNLYTEIVSTVMNEKISWNDGEGVLYDVDGNGVQELILVYETYVSSEESLEDIPCMVCSVYTIHLGEIAALIDTMPIYEDVGGPTGSVKIISVDNETIIAVTAENGGYGGGVSNRGGEWYLYHISDDSVSEYSKVEYSYVESWTEDGGQILYNQSTANIDGEAVSYEDYENWVDRLMVLKSVDGMTDDWNAVDDGIPLEELLVQLGS